MCTKRLLWRYCLLASLTIGTCACERVSFPEPDGNGTGSESEKPTDIPDGSHNSGNSEDELTVVPFTVADFIEKSDSLKNELCWVAGYIVGYTERTMSQATFSAKGAGQSNVLIADFPWVEDETLCVPVELKRVALKKELSLQHVPGNLGKRVALLGMADSYFRVAGLRGVEDYVWLKPDAGEPPAGEEQKPDDGEQNPNPEDSIPQTKPEPQPKPEPNPEPLPKPNPEDSLGGPILFYVNGIPVQPVDRASALVDGGRYLLGTMPEKGGMQFIANEGPDARNGKYRKAQAASVEGEYITTDDNSLPAVFVLEKQDAAFRLYDEGAQGFLAYDVNGSSQSKAWLPLLTRKDEEVNSRFAATFILDFAKPKERIKTHKAIKYSEASNRKCVLHYNAYGNNFKINYYPEGVPVCLFWMK